MSPGNRYLFILPGHFLLAGEDEARLRQLQSAAKRDAMARRPESLAQAVIGAGAADARAQAFLYRPAGEKKSKICACARRTACRAAYRMLRIRHSPWEHFCKAFCYKFFTGPLAIAVTNAQRRVPPAHVAALACATN